MADLFPGELTHFLGPLAWRPFLDLAPDCSLRSWLHVRGHREKARPEDAQEVFSEEATLEVSLKDEQEVTEVKVGGDKGLLGQAQNDFTSQTHVLLFQCKRRAELANSGHWKSVVEVCASSDALSHCG